MRTRIFLRLLPLAAAAFFPLAASAQQVTVEMVPVADSTVVGSSASVNYGASDQLTLALGTPPHVAYPLIRFDLSSIPPGSQIHAATLTLQLTAASTLETLPIFISRADASWQEASVTWATRPGTTSTLAQQLMNRNEFTKMFPVTDLVTKDVNDPANANGFVIRSRETGTGYTWGFASRERSASPPKLTVTYTPAVDTAPPAVSGLTATEIGLTSAVIAFATDEDATATVEFGLDTLYGRSTSSTSTARDHRLTLFPLASNSTYHYRVRVADALGNAYVSGDRSFSTVESTGEFPAGTLLRASDSAAVYYMGSDGKRHPFPSSRVYFSWYEDFANVQVITFTQLSRIALGENVRYRPGVRLLKFDTVPTVYAVSRGGILRSIASESVAAAIFGSAWATLVDDLPDTLFGNYDFGLEIDSSDDYVPATERAGTTTIDQDQGRA